MKSSILELIRKASTDLSADVENSLREALNKEDSNSPAKNVLSTIIDNIEIARKSSTPICQDTGYLLFLWIYHIMMMKKYNEAILEGVRNCYI